MRRAEGFQGVRGGRPVGLSGPPAVTTVDYHTAGEPFRIVTGGVPPLEGATILEKRRFALERLDAVRRLLVHEPRGHADMYGCFVTEPEDEGADLGVVFFHNAGYSTACGHGTIALVTWALESGVLPLEEPETRVVVDVPVRAAGDRGARWRTAPSARCGSATCPAFVEAEGLLAEGLRADVAFGGAFYASVASPLPVQPRNLPELIELGRAVKAGLEAQREFVHPLEPELRDIYGVIFWERVDRPAAPPAQRDRLRRRRGRPLALRQRHLRPPRRSSSGPASSPAARSSSTRASSARSSARGSSATPRSRAGPAVITEVEGSAYRTGAHEFALDPADPLGEGFLLR